MNVLEKYTTQYLHIRKYNNAEGISNLTNHKSSPPNEHLILSKTRSINYETNQRTMYILAKRTK